MGRIDVRWLTAGVASALALLGACGGDSNTTNNFSGCGPGTTMDPGTNQCVPLADGSAGTGGAAGAAGASGASGAGGVGDDASAGSDAEAGAAGMADQDAGDAQEEAPAPDPNDDTCITGDQVVINGDKACGEYKPAGICSATEPGTVEFPAPTTADLMLSDSLDPSSGGVWVRTPSHPGANPQCGIGCSSPGTIAKIVVPIRTLGTIRVAHSDPAHTMAPWRVSWEFPAIAHCLAGTTDECSWGGSDDFNAVFETSDPDAPARNFHIYAWAGGPGGCQ